MIFIRKILILLLIICLIRINSEGQKTNFQFSRLDISKGLSNNQVNSFFKDQKGFLWIGTMSGLNRYDGYEFKVFRHDLHDTNTISDNFILGIMEGPEGKLWVQTRSGFNIYDPVTEKFDRNVTGQLRKFGIPGGSVSSVRKNANGDFLFLIDQHIIYKYVVAASKSFILYKTNSPSLILSAFTEDDKKKYWLIYSNGLIEAIDSTGKQILQSDLPSKIYGKDSANYSLFSDSDNDLWIYASSGNPNGVVLYHPETGSYTHLEKDNGYPRLNTNLIVSIQQDDKGNIWICTDHGGVNIFNKKENTIQYLMNNVDDDKSLSQNSITAAYKDNTGIIWLGTYKRGVNYYHENIIKFPVYRHQPSTPYSLSFDDVNRFAEDAKGNLWIGTNGGGLLYFDRANNKFTQYLHQPNNSNSISNNVIVSLCIDHKQRLWIGSYFGGLDCFENGKFKHYRHDPSNTNSLSDDRVWEIFEDSKMNLWVGTLDGGLDRFDREHNIFYHHNTTLSNSIHSNYVAAIIEDKQGKIWIGTNSGIDVLDNITGIINHYASSANNTAGLSNNDIISILEDSRGLIWIGTRDGLNVFHKRDKKFQSFRTDNGLPSNTILNILEDNKGRLWISTSNGISKIRVTINNENRDTSVHISCTNYDELDGLQGTEFNENAALKTSRGEIIFGGANGFNLFNPDNIITDKSLPNLVLTDLQIFNKSVGVGEKMEGRIILPQSISNTSSITLKYNENILALEFAALNFSNPEKTKYAYLLQGFNNNWVITDGKMRKAIYTNLDPGTYTFRLKALNEAGKWSEKEIDFRIKILPPFWRSSLAFVIYGIMIVVALLIARKIILERARMRFEVEHQRKEAERIQELDAMKTRFFTNVSHEFRTPLSLILSPLDKVIRKSSDAEQKKQLHLIERNAKRLLNLVNQLLDFRKMEVQEFTLHLSKGDIVKFTKDITCSFSDISEKKDIQLGFKSNVETVIAFFDKDKLEKILFNLLSNAFKYTHAKGKVSVEMIYHDEKNNGILQPSLLIKICDNGIGIPADMHAKIFERYFQNNLPGNAYNYGTGIGLAITKEFVKLHEGIITVESEPEKGTCFTVLLPVKTGENNFVVTEPEGASLISEKEASLQGDASDNGAALLNHHPKRNTILLVEDSEDFRFYLKDNLKHRYNVIEAVNGKEGLEKVKNFHPDIVVSDIMMPVMNGIELSQKIKSNPDTSHIPVILLTALTTVEKELEGFNAGISDYITKPFTFEILVSRIRNHLNLREQLRKKFQKLVDINPNEITITPVDEEFMKRALEIVEKNIQEPDFSVEDLSHELFISRVALYKKLLSLTGKSPIEFIRVMRLKRAAQLLQKSQMNIAEIAYEVGFNNPKIFSRYFKEEFRITPSQYQASAKQNGKQNI
jgi:signal transduction histidine kinase/ligand-binding sensor domain-containing protein/DNA-binding response OmpR family regulator